ncbi:MAG TPA: hypothetical protein VHM25_18165, partial [Polyangiaceae bacterium]|nr:hypothetical protein [Polyangiaceae bacterium]
PGLSKIIAGRSSEKTKAAEPPTTAPPQLRSDPALPLARKSLAPTAAWVADAPAFSIIEPPPAEADEALNEPVLSLGRPKPFAPAEFEPVGPPWTLEFEVAVQALDAADTPERVVSGLCEGLAPVRALVFAVRGSSFDVRGGSPGMGTPAELRTISVPAASGSLLDTTTRVGFYLGPFVPIAALSSLDGKWSAAPGSDCYARAVNVSERPSLVVLMCGFSESTEATRRADVLSRAAGSALTRIVRMRKQS